MKKVLSTFSLLLLLASFSFAQSKPGIILKGGLNLANISTTDNGSVDEANMLTSFHAGLLLHLPFNSGFAFQPGLLVSGKGAKVQDGQPSDANYYRATTNPIYLEMPLNFVGRIPLGNSAGIYLGAGPYVAMGIAGKNKVEGKVLGVSFNSENKIEWSNDDPTTLDYEEDAGIGKMKRFDVGANLMGGIDFGKLSLGLNYGFGFTKINSGADNNSNDKNKNRVLAISLGIKL